MNKKRFRRARELFEKASKLEDAERAEFLEHECEDTGIRRKVETLLLKDAGALDTVAGVGVEMQTAEEPLLGQIGNYKPIRSIGEGGMGEVYLAEQEKPLKRRVALKVIRPGMSSKEIIARFETERQALALMDHPNIARVLDAGATPDGRPYFVMEYVEGVRITDFCDRERLTTEERIRLLMQVCDGVQHAHQKGIIHRDLKPSNVIVSRVGDAIVPKIIDFGVAKATAQQLTERTLYTEFGQILGTPEYMSPEQAEITTDNVDTRTDVYSLGVLLYELLVGVLPFEPEDLRKAGLEEILRKIREDVPLRPSTRITKLGERSTTHAGLRQTNPRRLRSDLNGDLDWITMRCLEKDRSRRYGSPSELAADLKRFLENLPVTAGPPSVVYQLRKFVRRHTAGVAAGAVLLLALLGFAVTMTVQAGRIARERDRANREAERATQQAETARRTSEFLVDLFDTSDPTEAKGDTVTAREVLDRGVERIQDELEDEPAVKAALLRSMGRVYTMLGLYDQARPLLESALEFNRIHPGEGELELASTQYDLAWLDAWTDRDKEAEPLARSALAIHQRSLDPDHDLVANSHMTLGMVLQHLDRLDEAEAEMERAVSILERSQGSEYEGLARVFHNLAIVDYFQGDLESAEERYKRSIAIEEKSRGTDSHTYATSLHTLAIVYQDQGRLEEALELEERSLAIREKVLGPNHYHTALSLTTMGNILRLAGRHDEAEPYIRRALAIGEASLGPGHGEVIWMRRSLARTLAQLDRVPEALQLLEYSMTLFEEKEEEPDVYSLGTIADLYRRADRYRDAERHYQWSSDITRRDEDPHPGDLGLAMAGLANVYRDEGRYDEAEPLYRKALPLMEGVWGPEDRDRLRALRDLVLLLRATAREGEAAELEAEADSLDR